MLKLLAVVLLLPQSLYSYGERLALTSDAPAILGSSVTFRADLLNPIHNEYTIFFQENYPNSRSLKTSLQKVNGFSANWTLLYDKAPGNLTITVTVAYNFIFEIPVDSVLYYYEITQNFTGELEISQPGVSRKQPWSVSTLNETELYLKVHDPSNYLNEAQQVSYVWIQNGTTIGNNSSPTVRVNFTKEFIYPVKVDITAMFIENGTQVLKYGSFEQNISAKVPVSNFTVHGATWFRHGKMLDLTLTCNGTSPFEYCWMFKFGPYNTTGNETCQPTVTTECNIHISRYFEAGTYNLLVLLNNDVGKIFNQTGIHVYKTTRKPQLSIIIVPISFTIIAIVLIIFGVAYYWENHAKFTVEVADFDFGQTNESAYVRFLDHLRDAVSTSVRLRAGKESPLLPDNESSVFRYGAINNPKS